MMFAQKVLLLPSRLPCGWTFQSRKTLRQIFQILSQGFLATWYGDLFVTHFSREKCVSCALSFFFFFPRQFSKSFHFSFMHHYHCSYLHLLLSFLLDPFVYQCQKGREYTLEQYTRKFCHFYMTFMHILRGRNSISCAHLQGEKFIILVLLLLAIP